VFKWRLWVCAFVMAAATSALLPSLAGAESRGAEESHAGKVRGDLRLIDTGGRETGASASASASHRAAPDFSVAVEQLPGVGRNGRVGMRLRVRNKRKWTATSVHACASLSPRSGRVVGIVQRGSIRYGGRSACWVLRKIKPKGTARLWFQVKPKRTARHQGLHVSAWAAGGNSNPASRRKALVPAHSPKRRHEGKRHGSAHRAVPQAAASAAPTTCASPARLGLVFTTDDSGSMAISDPGHIRSQAISVGLDQLPDGSLAAATSFSDYSWELFDATSVDPTTRPSLKNAATMLFDEGNTDYEEAFLGAKTELASMATADRKAIVFLSDGLPSYSDFVADQAIAAAGTPIYTIGLGVAGDPEAEGVLAGIAARSGAQYFGATSAGQLQSIFARIVASLTCGSQRVTETFQLKPGESKSVPFSIGPGDGEFRALASWSSGAVNVSAQRPTGTTMAPTTLLAGESFVSEPTYALLSGRNPLVGPWSLTVTAQPSNLSEVSVTIDVFGKQLPLPPIPPPAKGRHLDPCVGAFSGGRRKTTGKLGGKETVFDRTESLYQVCAGFGAPEGLDLSPEMKCALIAAAATFAAGPISHGVDQACDALSVADALQSGNWLGAAASKACGYFSEVFAGAVGVVAAGATVETGPGAAAVGLWTYRALSAGLKIACGGLLDGGAAALGAKFEADHEQHIALDVTRKGKCIAYREQFHYVSWRAVDCP
jgi:hypothetical protein